MNEKKLILDQVKREFGNSVIMNRLFKRYFKKCKAFHLGRSRVAFEFSTYVVKLPITYGGIGDNDWEGSISNNPDLPPNDYQIQYARTRLVYLKDRLDSIPIVLMEKVEFATVKEIVARLGKEPRWCWSVDCGQVGWNRQGKLVAYDYGLN